MNALLDRLPLWAALVPLAAYLAFLAGLHLRRRPCVLSGTWDGILLAGALAGLAVAGPLAVVRPALGSTSWGWLIAGLACGLAVAICTLATRPRLVVYNISVEQLRPFVAEVVGALDPAARWAGTSVVLPTRRLQLHLDGAGGMRCVSVVSVGERAAHEGWTEFSRRLCRAVGRIRVRRSPWAAAFAGAGAAVLAAAVWAAVR
ncbi:MAG: hypothetical protein EBZ74_04005 [Planctomycetia bacterium]|nr:hypothetical protein [Planctomycetia bacterium]